MTTYRRDRVETGTESFAKNKLTITHIFVHLSLLDSYARTRIYHTDGFVC